MNVYHYTECGLNNVYIHGLPEVCDDDGDLIVTIPHVNLLHRSIAQGIVSHSKGISASELRFLRSEMGMIQAELAKIAHVDKQTIGRWERSETDIDGAVEALVRKLSIERLELEVESSIEELSSMSVPTAAPQKIVIYANDAGYDIKQEKVAA